ncbi:phosphoserine phosphatase KNAG_0G00730 [Huiozyma naganishii CBS 8797]|uniref:phosphoserine phosphatase n=1 Tax=Huiozyma naganishii (strain ATCC MYA-139 / BCRC 22969 / CBS 8797 / KCTC 17520 / NBRC 10181 / NCYC 3082 / Yp74L-3) TaxID=1071383 RepID=J7S7R6_HUIN7|nr:hypothetical protein KNAG_0G00730 [Kazachstania naganishii CBS 8797]CCK71129.1 hypothetical protein KNAG_0G00730 [Kazachstania naganishii CBS 8797]
MTAYVVTYISQTADELSDASVETLCGQLRAMQAAVQRVDRLGPRACDVYVEGNLEKRALQEGAVSAVGADAVLQLASVRGAARRLVVFDMDSTLIEQEVIELVARHAGVEPAVKEITDRAMNGELDFKASLRERVALLAGLDTGGLYDSVRSELVLTQGADQLCQLLRESQVSTAVLSGGFVPFAGHIQRVLQLDYMRANTLETTPEGILTGRTLGPVVDGTAKANAVRELCSELGIDPQSSVMVGDGANDLPAMATAGFGVAWHAKPAVREAAPSQLNGPTLFDVKYVLGYRDT